MTHIVRRSMSLLLAVLFCLSLVTLPVLAIEGEDQPTSTPTESVADPDSGNQTEGDTPADPTDQSPSTSTDGENQATPDADKAQDTDQGKEQNGANSTTEGNGDYKEQEGNSEENNGDPVNPGNNEETKSTEPVPDGFFTALQLGTHYNPENGTMTDIKDEQDVQWDAECAVRLDYTVPSGAEMQVGTEYTFTIDAPLLIDGTFNIKDGNTVVAIGSMTPQGNGTTKGTLTFQEEMENYVKPGVSGHFFLNTKLKESKSDGGGKKDIVIKVEGQIEKVFQVDFEAPTVESKVELRKEARCTDPELMEKQEIEWTLTVTPSIWNLREKDKDNAHLNFLKVVDTIDTTKMSYVENSVTVVDKDGHSLDGNFTYEQEDGKLAFVGGEEALKASSWPITIKFKTSYDLENEKLKPDDSGNLHFTNEATATILAPEYVKDETGKVQLKENDTNDPDSAEKEKTATAKAEASIAYVSLSKEWTLKTGRSVTWKITAKNPFKQKNSYIIDTLPENMVLDGEITLATGTTSTTLSHTATSGPRYEYDQQNRQLTIYLDDTYDGDQIISYTTKFGDDVTQEQLNAVEKVVNQADLHFGPNGGHTMTKTAEVHFGDALLAKDGKYDPQTHTITWRVTLKTDGKQLSKITLTDRFVQEVERKKISQTYVDGSMKIIDTKNNSHRYLTSSDGLQLDQDKKGFTLTIRDAHPEYEELEYQTVLETGDDSVLTFWGNNNSKFLIKNTISVTADGLDTKAQVTGTVQGYSTVLQKKAGSYNYLDKTITWKLTINQNQMKLEHGQIVDTLKDMNWKYVQGEGAVTATLGGKSVSLPFVTYSTGEDNKQTMTIQLPKMETGDGPLVITYKTRLANDNLLLTNDKLTAANTATLTGDQIKEDGVTDSASREVGQSVLKKSISQALDAHNELTWSVEVNRNLATVTALGENAQIGIQDILQAGLSYVDGSMVMEELTINANGDVTGKTVVNKDQYTVEYDKASRELKILWKDSTINKAYRLTFKTLVMISGTYSNTVSFIGVSAGKETDSMVENAYAVFGGGYTSLPAALGELVIEKRDGTDTTKLLPGAKFKIIDENNLAIGIFTTDSKGMITAVLPVGKYTIVEVGTPDNYAIEKQKVTTWEVTVKSQDRVTMTVYNYLDKDIATYSPKVTKELKGRTTSTEKFTFKLEAVDNAPMPEKDTTVTLNGVTGVTETDTVSFGQIQYTVPGIYHYTITEEDGKASRYTYDTKPHTLTVTVVYVTGTNGTKQLTATAKYDTDKDSLTITNTYKKPSGGGGTVTPDPKPDPVPPVDPVDPVEPDPDPDKPTEPTEPDKPTDPDQPSQPEQPETPSQPTTPTQPSRPNRPSIPQYPIDRLPDPSDPSSPDEIIIIDDDDVPLGNFYKEQEPDGSYAYVDKKGHMYGRTMPKGTQSSGRTPQTGVPMTVPALAITGGLCAVGGTVLWFGGKKKKDEA